MEVAIAMATQVRTIERRDLGRVRTSFVIFACLLLPLGIWLFLVAAAQGHIREAHGHVASLEGVYRVSSGRYSRYVHGTRAECGDGNSCGQYEYSVLTISEDVGEYRIYPDSFQPALSRWFAQEDEPVRFWYTGGPLVDNNIVAITVGTETYLTDDYTHPRQHVLEILALAVAVFVPGVGLGWLGVYLPRLARRHPRVAEFFQSPNSKVPAPRHHKETPIRPARGVAKAVTRRSRRARR